MHTHIPWYHKNIRYEVSGGSKGVQGGSSPHTVWESMDSPSAPTAMDEEWRAAGGRRRPCSRHGPEQANNQAQQA